MINENLLKNEERIVYKLRSIYSEFGYTQYKMSKFEEYDLYVRNKDFLISDRIITFTDTNGKLLALKPDVTLSIIKNTENRADIVQKMYYDENVYRVSGNSGKFKEIMQTGLECIGKIGIYEICEVLYLAIKSLKVIDDNFALELSHAGLMTSLIVDAGINEEIIPLILQCIKMKNSALCMDLYNEERISKQQAQLVNCLIDCYDDIDCLKGKLSVFAHSDECKKYLDEFTEIFNCVSDEAQKGKIIVNFSLSSDVGYYSGVVFKGYINSIATSVLSGGQYDKLLKKFKIAGGAIGFAVYLDVFERFNSVVSDYDVDNILLVEGNFETKAVLRKAEEIKASGESVLVQSTIPENIKYRKIIKMGE